MEIQVAGGIARNGRSVLIVGCLIRPVALLAVPFEELHGPSWREKVNKSRPEVALARHHSYFEA